MLVANPESNRFGPFTIGDFGTNANNFDWPPIFLLGPATFWWLVFLSKL
ncbi:hypothetical protein Q7C_181 [Methylophaga frappieri]|uniref:Uncharacterized protein n=1 Tax=Methylophaga frappieri (strain ATCC BAA-2434 / DSM 25690 / JAM7) TaxID=754477 RepID=I1YEL9_METFJ|nr:hypothetical protein Q7C_181 [Methylophaga frappieri]